MSYDFRVVSLNLRTKHLYTSMCIILIVIRKNLSEIKSAYFFQSLNISLEFRSFGKKCFY